MNILKSRYFQQLVLLALLFLKVDSACRDSDYRTAFGNPAYTKVYDETALAAMQGAIFVGFNFLNGSTNYQVIYMLNIEKENCQVEWEKNLKLADAKVVSLAVDNNKNILAALVKDAGSSEELVYRFYIKGAANKSFSAGDVKDVYSTGMATEPVLMQALIPSTTKDEFFFVLREASLDKLDFASKSYSRLEYSVSSKTLDVKQLETYLYFASYNFENDRIVFEVVDETFESQYWKHELTYLFEAGDISTYKTANARIAVQSFSWPYVFIFSCINVDDGGASQDVVFSSDDFWQDKIQTLTLQNRWANCVAGVNPPDTDSVSFLLKDKDVFYIAEVNFVDAEVVWQESQKWNFFANGANTFRANGQYLMVDKEEEWFFVGLTNQIASAKFNYLVGVVASTENSRINEFWRSENTISSPITKFTVPFSYSDNYATNFTPTISSASVESLDEIHPELAHNYWMDSTTCGVGKKTYQRQCTYWEIFEHMPKTETLSSRQGVPVEIKDCDFEHVFFPSSLSRYAEDVDPLHAACFPFIIQGQDRIPQDKKTLGDLVEKDSEGVYFWFGDDWTKNINPKEFWLMYEAEYESQFSKELYFKLTVAKNTKKVVLSGQDWVQRFTSDFNEDKMKQFNVTCWSELCPEWIHVDKERKQITINSNDTESKSAAGIYAYLVTFLAQIDCDQEVEHECEPYYFNCNYQTKLREIKKHTGIKVTYDKTDQDYKKVYQEQCDILSGHPNFTRWQDESEICSHDLSELCDTLQYPWIHKKQTLLIKVKYQKPLINIDKPYEIWFRNHWDSPSLHYTQPTVPLLDPRKSYQKKKKNGSSGNSQDRSSDLCPDCPESWTDEILQTAYQEALQRNKSNELPVQTNIQMSNTGLIKLTFVPALNLPSYMIQEEVVETPKPTEVIELGLFDANAAEPEDSGRQLEYYTDEAYYTDEEWYTYWENYWDNYWENYYLYWETYWDNYWDNFWENYDYAYWVAYYEAYWDNFWENYDYDYAYWQAYWEVNEIEYGYKGNYYDQNYVDYYEVEYYEYVYYEETQFDKMKDEKFSNSEQMDDSNANQYANEFEDLEEEVYEEMYMDKCELETEYYDQTFKKCEKFRIYVGEIEDMFTFSIIPDPKRGENLSKQFLEANFRFSTQFLSVNSSMIQIQATFSTPQRITANDKFVVQMENFAKFDRSFLIGRSEKIQAVKMTPILFKEETVTDQNFVSRNVFKSVAAGTIVAKLLMNGALSQIWGMLHGLKFIIHLHTFSVDTPENVNLVIKPIISIATFDIPYVDMGNITQSILFNAEGIEILTDFQNEEYYPELISSLQQLGYNSAFSSDCMDSTFVLLGIGLLLSGFTCILFCLRWKFPGFMNSLYSKLVNTFFWGFFIRIFFEINIDQAFISILNIRYGNFYLFPEDTVYGIGVVINYFVALTWMASFVVVPLFLTVYFWIPQFNYGKLQTSWWRKYFGSLVEDLEIERSTFAYLVLFTLRRTVFAYLAIDLAWCLWAQLFCFTYSTILACCLILTYRVFQNDLVQRLEVFNEVIILSCVGVLFALKSTEYEYKDSMGNVYITLLFLNLFVHLFYIAKGFFRFLLLLFQKRMLRRRGYRSAIVDRYLQADSKSRCKKVQETPEKEHESDPEFLGTKVAPKGKLNRVHPEEDEIKEENQPEKLRSIALRKKKKQFAVPRVIEEVKEECEAEEVQVNSLRIEEDEDLKNWRYGLDRKLPNLFFALTPPKIIAERNQFFTGLDVDFLKIGVSFEKSSNDQEPEEEKTQKTDPKKMIQFKRFNGNQAAPQDQRNEGQLTERQNTENNEVEETAGFLLL